MLSGTIVLALFLPFAAQAQSEEKPIVIGAGFSSCGTWIEARHKPVEYYQYLPWVLGFITGSNWHNAEQQARPLDVKAVVAFIDQYCRNNPLHSLVLAAAAVVQETGGPKVHPLHQWKR